ncbi:MAG: TrkA family potassium uptake protein, partial [Actinomycetota bacterium]|nr:TrkA family potassium uptake protein [Actinomycetota bacterium]
GVTVVCVKRRGEDFSYATPETVLGADDLLIVAGKTELAERFASRA